MSLCVKEVRADRVRIGSDRISEVQLAIGSSGVPETFVIDAQEVQDRGVEVVHMHAAAGDVVAKLVGGTVAETAFHTAPRHPERETARVMVAAVVVPG